MQFDLTTPQGRLIANLMASLAEFERDVIRERIKSGIASAKAEGKSHGRRKGDNYKSDKLVPKIIGMIENGISYREIAKLLKINKNTVLKVAKNRWPNIGASFFIVII